ncbi:MAG: lytic transglycosylase domain-containing protein [Planctomycetes bacterium]|nr:lytic transglycosylase domain-containing protein [Planctomycetota bacterium]
MTIHKSSALPLFALGATFAVTYALLRASSPVHAVESYRPLACEAAERAGIDPNLLLALVTVESQGDPHARSSAGALGLTQLKLIAARDAAAQLGEPPPTAEDLFVPATSLRLGAAYLRWLIQRFGDTRVALAAYLKGPEWVARSGGVEEASKRLRAPSEVSHYVQRILELSARLSERATPAPPKGH